MAKHVTIAQAPFNDKDADVILRSRDKVDFYVHKVVLSLASPFFKGMFTLVQAPSDSKQVPVIDMTEDSTTLDYLLRYCFPVRKPVISDIPTAVGVLEAAKKYGLEEALEGVQGVFHPLAASDPLQLYAISCHFGWEVLAKEAAKALKATRDSWKLSALFTQNPSLVYTPDMDTLPAGCLYRLTRFLTHGDIERFCATTRPPRPAALTAALFSSTWPFNSPTADMVIRSADGVNFRVHRLVIGYHTLGTEVPIERSLFRPSGEKGTYAVEDGSEVLASLLRLCYPSATSIISEWTTQKYCDPLSIKVVKAAENHGITAIVRDYAANFDKHVPHDPLGTYAVAVQFGWSTKALAAAREAVQLHTVDRLYSLPLENIPAIHLYRLWRFSHRFYAAVPSRIEEALDGNSKRLTTHWRKPGNHGVSFEDVDRISILATVSRMPLSQTSSYTFGTLLRDVQSGVADASSKVSHFFANLDVLLPKAFIVDPRLGSAKIPSSLYVSLHEGPCTVSDTNGGASSFQRSSRFSVTHSSHFSV